MISACDVVADLNVSVKLFADDAKIYSELDLGLNLINFI
jgi:hypothetical protein